MALLQRRRLSRLSRVPDPADFEKDIASIEKLVADLKAESVAAEAKRPSMKAK